MVSQFVIQLENRPGELAHLTRALAMRGIDIRHIDSDTPRLHPPHPLSAPWVNPVMK